MGLFDNSDQPGLPTSDASAGGGSLPRKRGIRSLPSQASECLQRGGLVLTGNARAARALGLAYAATQQRNGLEAWAAPQIMDWSAFLASLWNQILLNADDAPLLLSPLQEHALWRDMAERHGDAGLVVSIDGMAELAQSAYARLNDYEVNAALRRSWDYAGSRDAESFRNWAVSFEEVCADQKWISRSALSNLVTVAIRAGHLAVPREILLTGFDRIVPVKSRVLTALEGCGTRITFSDQPEQATLALHAIVEAKDRREEIAACAHWARQLLMAAPASRIGVFVEEGARARGEMERTFLRVLMPASLGITAPLQRVPYEFSLGRPLATVPLVRAALLLLRWLDQPLPQEEVSWLLMSGFLAERTGQLIPAAQLDAAMRQRDSTTPEISLTSWLSHSDRYLNASQPSAENGGLGKRLLHAQRTAARSISGGERGTIRNSVRTYSEWIEIALDVLPMAGWPGPESEDSAQFQARKKFEQMTDSIAALGFNGKRVDYREFVATVLHTAGGTIFQPQSRNAAIQIMGPMEAAGQEFDAIWFLGVDHLHWPANAAPHPLLPVQLQRESRMPHADVQADWELAIRVTQRVAASAPECIISYSKQLTDGAVKLSPVVSSICSSVPAVTKASAFLCGPGHAPAAAPEMQTVEAVDTSAIPWPIDVTAGGTEILKMQAACPFKAFATRRLGAGELHEPERGLSAKDRGVILHEILQHLWSADNEPPLRLQTLADLLEAKTEGRIASILDHHVTAVMSRRRAPSDAWETAYIANEKERLCTLLAEWLDKEAARLPFVVEACERKLNDVQVGDLKLNLRIDRIDGLAAGKLLIDYKTGKVTKAAWESDRPDEPQLPLYAAYGDVDDVRGVLFAQLRANELGFTGRVMDAKKSFQAPSAKGSNPEPYDATIRDKWADTLLSLAQDFLDGDASVTPKKYLKTCEHCPLPTLCRVADTSIPVEANAVDDPEPDYASGEARYE